MGRLPTEIVTPRLRVRLWTVEDVPALGAAVAASLEHLRPWMAWAHLEPLTDEERRHFVESGRGAWESGGDASYGIFRDDEIVGACGLHRRHGPGVIDLGYWIHVDHLGRGYAREVAAHLTSAAFGATDTERVEIHHDRANDRSRAVPRSLGFTPGPERADGVHAPAEAGIDCTWSVTRAEWERLRYRWDPDATPGPSS